MSDDLEQAIKAVEEGDAVLLDVRTLAEHTDRSAKHALHLAVEDIAAGADPDIEVHETILIHCRSGGRAGNACQILSARGYRNVHNVGGLDDWLAAGGQPN